MADITTIWWTLVLISHVYSTDRKFVYDIWRYAVTRFFENYGKIKCKYKLEPEVNDRDILVNIWTCSIVLVVFIKHLFYFQSLSFQKITRIITEVDSQPMFDGGVLINVLGRLKVIIMQVILSYRVVWYWNLSFQYLFSVYSFRYVWL